MSPANIEVSEIQPQLSRAEQEAAVQFANGHADAAIEILVEVLRAEKVAPLPAWLMLFELFRLQGRWPDFEDLSKRYTALFGRAAPQWLSADTLPEGLSAKLQPGGAAHVEIRGSLGSASAPDLARIRVVAAEHPVVHVDLTKISQLQEKGCALLSDELKFLVREANGVLFSGVERIETMLRQAVEAKPKAVAFWQLFLDLQRLQGNQKKFESIALEYALYVETDPPAWEPVLMPVLPRETVDEKREEPRYQPELIDIAGEMTGLKDPQLQALQRFASPRQYVNIDMARLRRIDFVCAGSLANVIAGMKRNGKTVRVLHANSLVTTLLRLLKVDESPTLAAK
ncbi:MAG TPA: STAS domain-containing protein [Burkholderiales bacterium]|nr:STAS domain-containing protein [Burkholderiales bacterium]